MQDAQKKKVTIKNKSFIVPPKRRRKEPENQKKKNQNKTQNPKTKQKFV